MLKNNGVGVRSKMAVFQNASGTWLVSEDTGRLFLSSYDGLVRKSKSHSHQHQKQTMNSHVAWWKPRTLCRMT